MSGAEGPRVDRDTPLPQAEGDAETLSETGLVQRLVGIFRRPAVRQRILAPMGFDAAILVTNLATGIIVARALGPSGRGELAATLMLAQMAAWLFSAGSSEAISYYQARYPESGAKLMSSWLAVSVPLAAVAVIGSELLLPTLFSAQTADAIDLARIYMAVIPIIALQQICSGMLLGDHDFFLYNLTRFLYPALSAALYAAALVFDSFTVAAALAINGAAMAVAVAVSVIRVLSRHGVARPDRELIRKSLGYGLRSHIGSTAGLVNGRLDLIIIPGFLSAASVGLYSVATNVSSIITVLTGTVAVMVLPVAARREGSPRTVVLTMHAALLISLAIALPLLALAPQALEIVYGSEFRKAATVLRLLLPGAVFQAVGVVLNSGLLAAEKPLWVSAAVLPGALLTIGGLILFLPIGGITAAAILTSSVYLIELVAVSHLYRRALGLRWRDFVVAPDR